MVHRIKGLVTTADRFSDSAYDFIETLSRDNISFRQCSEPERALLGFKCVRFKKYTIVFEESESEILIREVIPSKLIKW